MKEIKETRFLLNEDRFSQLCKVGHIRYQTISGSTDVTFYKVDILTLSKGEVVSKDLTDEILQFKLIDQLDQENIREIIKRSPIFYELSTQI
jgi:hypothetical protein